MWRTPRADEAPSWATPLVYEGPSRTEIVTLAPNFARGYDPLTGKELWRLGKHSIYASPSPIPGPGLFVITSGSGNSVQPIYAIRAGADGDITLKDDEEKNGAVIWSRLRGGAYIPTPLLYDGLLYVTSEGGILAAYKIDTGERVYQQRMTRGGSYSSSAVAADGRLYRLRGRRRHRREGGAHVRKARAEPDGRDDHGVARHFPRHDHLPDAASRDRRGRTDAAVTY